MLMTKKQSDILVGGQALIEGVMMKGQKWLGIAIRKNSKRIKVKTQRFKPWSDKVKILGWPFIRGFFNLLQMMIIGINALTYSANEAAEEELKKLNKGKKLKQRGLGFWEITITLVISFAFALALFKFVPLLLAQLIADKSQTIGANSFLFALIDGIIKICLFILYIYLISLMKDIKSVFQYHGAEHMTVYCYEAKKTLNVENAKKFPKEHPRCGTSFIMGVLIISILVYTLIPMSVPFFMKFFLRILLLPVIAGISYEVLRLTSKNRNNPVFKIITAPGLWTQKITTKKPNKKQMEVAIAALKTVLKKEKIAF